MSDRVLLSYGGGDGLQVSLIFPAGKLGFFQPPSVPQQKGLNEQPMKAPSEAAKT